MQQMTIDLDNKQLRPVAILDNGLAALVDTGAYIPVWVDDETVLYDIKCNNVSKFNLRNRR